MKQDKFFLKPEAVENMQAVYEILQHANTHYPDRIAYRQINGRDKEFSITFSAFYKQVNALRAALLNIGLAGKHIAIIGETCIEWISAYLAIVSGVGVAVPIDRELPPETMAKQLDQADVDYVFCTAKAFKKLSKAIPLCDGLRYLFIMRDMITPETDIPWAPFTMLCQEGAALIQDGSYQEVTVPPDDVCLIIFTSGTTGANKGVMLSNRNIMGTLRGCARLLHYPATSFSVLPVNHSYELHAHLMSCLYCGTEVALNDDLKHLLKNLEHFSPEMSCMVPMMLDLIVRRLKKEIQDKGKPSAFRRSILISNTMRKAGIDMRRTFFKSILEPLGGKLRMIICGGAALSQETVDFLDQIGIQVYNGYGITECSPVAAVNPYRKSRKHSVGHILPTTDVRIADPDADGNGEIQLRGDNIMLGYYNAPDDTEKVFTEDGWFKTGDIGHQDKDHFLYISGRLKNLIILSNGKNVFPEEVEDELVKRIPGIRECVVYADENAAGLSAMAYLDRDFCREKNLAALEEQRRYLQEALKSFNQEMPGYKRIISIEARDREFEKNTTHKIQRFKILTANK